MRRVPFVVGLLLGTSACAQGGNRSIDPSTAHTLPSQQMVAELQQLSEDEIRALIVGRTLTHDVNRRMEGRGVVVLSPYREMYRPDGTVSVLIHRAGLGGRYTIGDDRLCLFLDNQPPECRYLFRAADGALVQKDALDPAGGATPIIVE